MVSLPVVVGDVVEVRVVKPNVSLGALREVLDLPGKLIHLEQI